MHGVGEKGKGVAWDGVRRGNGGLYRKHNTCVCVFNVCVLLYLFYVRIVCVLYMYVCCVRINAPLSNNGV